MPLSDYDFHLPQEHIAQVPADRREESRLLVLDRSAPDLALDRFHHIGRYLRSGDLLVLNDTRVFPARLRGRRPTGGRVEVFLLSPLPEDPLRWRALVRPAKAGRGPGALRIDGAAQVEVEAVAEEDGGLFQVQVRRAGEALDPSGVFAVCEEAGEVPLPPYIRREPGDSRQALDRERYQTVYALHPGAAAAPTAGLHFTRELLEELEAQGIGSVAVTLAVGLGTFQPLREETLQAGRLHREAVSIGAAAAGRVLEARAAGGRIVAVGTTSARALESWALAGSPVPQSAWKADTDLLIGPGYRFRLVDALVTNFHLPRSSLLLLVSALAGRERILDAYRRAIAEGLRFYSYGDAMLIL